MLFGNTLGDDCRQTDLAAALEMQNNPASELLAHHYQAAGEPWLLGSLTGATPGQSPV